MRLWSFLVIPFLVTLTYGAPVSEVAPPAAVAQKEDNVALAAEVVPAVIVPDVAVAQSAEVVTTTEVPVVSSEAPEVVVEDVATTISPVEQADGAF